MIISHEGLSNHFIDFPSKNLARFRKLTEKYRTTLFFVSRDKQAWLSSYFKQCIINPQNASSELWGTALDFRSFCDHPRVVHLLDYQSLAREMYREYGAQRMVHLSYDNDDWFGAIQDCLGAKKFRQHQTGTINDSVPDWSICLIHHINGIELSSDVRDKWIAAQQLYLNTNNIVFIRALQDSAATGIFGADSQITVDIIDDCAAKHGKEIADKLEGFRSFVICGGET